MIALNRITCSDRVLKIPNRPPSLAREIGQIIEARRKAIHLAKQTNAASKSPRSL